MTREELMKRMERAVRFQEVVAVMQMVALPVVVGALLYVLFWK